MRTRFKDREEAGRELASRLAHLAGLETIVLALPRGGVPVGYEIAHALHVPFDILNVRKLGVPWHEELALGAIAAGGRRVLNHAVIMATGVTGEDLDAITRLQQLEIDRRERLYRNGRPAPVLQGKTVILVDDGIATGATVRAAISVVRAQSPARLVLAVPVAQASVAAELADEVDDLVCVLRPADLNAIGAWYDAFDQLTDRNVQNILAKETIARPDELIEAGAQWTLAEGAAGDAEC